MIQVQSSTHEHGTHTDALFGEGGKLQRLFADTFWKCQVEVWQNGRLRPAGAPASGVTASVR